ncbi:MAG: ATP-binding protein [Naasia sp.]
MIDGIARGTRTVAAVCLAGALAVSAAIRAETASESTAGILAAILVAGAALLLLALTRTRTTATIYVVTGGAAVTGATAVVAGFPPVYAPAAEYAVDLLWVAAVMVGGIGLHRGSGLAWTAAGLAAGALGSLLGALLAGSAVRVGIVPLAAAALVAVIYVLTGSANGRRIRLAQPRIHRAARDERLAEVRSGVEMRAAALLHDTVLGSLAAIANGPVGPITEPVAHAVERDLDAIIGQDWTERVEARTPNDIVAALATVVDDTRALGLVVQVTGDTEALERLAPAAADSLALAVRQLLVNVHQHSGASSAEVVIVSYVDSVSVMVIDGGIGFVPAEVPGDRLGIRSSVVARAEALGGGVRIWSTPGRGTSVLITLPAPAESPDPQQWVGASRGEGSR